jgi:hypothetical protein
MLVPKRSNCQALDVFSDSGQVVLNTLFTLRRGRLGVADISHQPDDTGSCQHNETDGDRPHKDHPDPTEWRGSGRVSPVLHHAARSHHAPATKTPVAYQRACSKQDQNDEEAHYSNDQPVNFSHLVFPFRALLIEARAIRYLACYHDPATPGTFCAMKRIINSF